ncbi:DoxX family membrane protein [Kribbella solani]|uniref:MauE/DoxX family redox-associated membrane protein n=1 Tax=Kribbella solani TaxID=236067 RepID=UPI0029B2ACCD|nr:MauE/DoxX family redox-associated membrane protein [Kribbella solani]MDX2973731.1 DoxX family membrane protein [Kribbella solani]MDX3000413.1 DoxX family membrane protein [Kribbella solani]
MKRRPWFAWASLVARLALGGVMLVAGALKVTDPETAAQAVRAYELLPSSLAAPVGWGLPFLEVAIGLLLMVGFGVRASAVAAGIFMLAFIVAVASAWARGLSIDCGCFGGGGQVAPGQTKYLQEILRDIGLLALAVWLWRFPASKFAVASETPSPTGVTAP